MQKIITINLDYRPFAVTHTDDFTEAFQSYLDDGWVIEHLSTTYVGDSEDDILIITVLLRK